MCFDFQKGRCSRGSDCRYSHGAPPAPPAPPAAAARHFVAVDGTGEMEVMFEEADGEGLDAALAPGGFQRGSFFVAKKWRVVCEGARVGLHKFWNQVGALNPKP
jgi:hypothetical protein